MVAGQSGNFQLNVMLPVIADCLLESISLLSQACVALADKAISGFEVEEERLRQLAERNPILATVLAPMAGYELTAKIVKRAREENRSLKDVAMEMTDVPKQTLEILLDPRHATGQE